MAKLKDLLEESFSMVGGLVTQKPINPDSSLTGIVEDIYGEKPSKVSANEILEAIRTFNSIGKHMKSEANLRKIAKSLSEIARKAKTHTVQETEDWFDKVTVNRNMKDLTTLSNSFNKIAGEAHTLQERMNALYEDMGYILNRYYEMEGGEEHPQADQEDDMVKAGLKNVKGADIKEGDYDAFFQKAMKKFGIKSPAELDDEKKKEFFNYVDKNYSAKNETVNEGINSSGYSQLKRHLHSATLAVGVLNRAFKKQNDDKVMSEIEYLYENAEAMLKIIEDKKYST